MLLDVKNIDVLYDDFQVIWDVSINVNKAEMVALLGIKFGADGQNEKTRGILMQVQNGKYCTVYPFELAACELKYPMPTWSER